MAGDRLEPSSSSDDFKSNPSRRAESDNSSKSLGADESRKRRLSESTLEEGFCNGQNKKLHLSSDAGPSDAGSSVVAGSNADDSSTNGSVSSVVVGGNNGANKSPDSCHGSRTLLDFSDELFLDILRNCDSRTLLAISQTCQRLRRVACDHELWETFDFSEIALRAKTIKRLMKFICAKTKNFLVRGFTNNRTITGHMLHTLRIRSPALQTLSLRNGYIDLDKISIIMFPRTLEHLFFIGTHASPRPLRYFQGMEEYLPSLVEVSFEYCPWFETYDLVPLSKLPKLRKLSLRGCRTLTDFVPYGSISARFGFKCLHTLDVRQTPITDSDLQCFNLVYSLRELYLECPTNSRHASNNHTENVSIDTDSSSPKTEPSELTSEEDLDSEDDDGEEDNTKKPCNRIASSEEALPEHSIISVSLMGNNSANNSGQIQLEERNINGIQCFVSVINNNVIKIGDPAQPVKVEETKGDQLQSTQSSEGAPSSAPSTSTSSSDSVTCRILRKAASSTSTASSPALSITRTFVSEFQPSTSRASPNEPQPSTSRAIESEPQPSTSRAFDSEPQPFTSRASANEPQPSTSQAVAADTEIKQQQIIFVQPGLNNNDNAQRIVCFRIDPLVISRREAGQSVDSTVFNQPRTDRSSISDRGIRAFGHSVIGNDLVWIRDERRPNDTNLEVLLLRNYRSVTNITLDHLSLAAPNLRFLDVTGTSVTNEGVEKFKLNMPNCHIIWDMEQ